MFRKELHQKNKKVNKCADSFNEDLCLPEDTRKMFSSFDFTPDDAVELWAVNQCISRKDSNRIIYKYIEMYLIFT